MTDRPRTTTRMLARGARFVTALACLLASGLIAPVSPVALVVPVTLAELPPPADECGHDAKSTSVAPTRQVRHLPMTGAPDPTPVAPHARRVALQRPKPADRSPASIPLRC